VVLVLFKIEQIIQKPIHEIFDLIVGTSTGAIIATLIGIKHFGMEQVLNIYTDLVGSTFITHALASTSPTDTPRRVNDSTFFQAWSSIVNVSSFLRKGYWYGTNSFEDLIRGITGDRILVESALESDNKVCLVSALMSVTPLEPYLFRNYNVPPHHTNHYKGECDTSILHAIRCSTSAPGYFDSMEIDGQLFRDGGMIANNPAGIAINQSKMLWPDRPIDLLVSCGTGRGLTSPILNANSYKQLVNQIVNSCSETEKTHRIISDLMPTNTYFRFQPIGDIFELGLDETDPVKIKDLTNATLEWITTHDEEIQTLCSLLTS